MGSKERRQRERGELRESILDAAREMFVTEGFESVTMRSLAKRIEYSPTAIYLHFKDKESLLKELCSRDLLALHTAMQEVVAENEHIEALYAVAQAYVRFAMDHKPQYQLLFMMPKPRNPELIATLDDAMAEPERIAYAAMRANWTSLIDSGLLKAEFKDADVLAQVWFCGLHGIVAAAILLCDAKSMPEWAGPQMQAKTFVDVILKGILK